MKPASTMSRSKATTGSHHAAVPSRIRIGMRIAENGGTNDNTVSTAPFARKTENHIAIMSMVSGIAVCCRSSVRDASAPATAQAQAMTRKPTRKKARNQPTPAPTEGR